ncbi:MAG: hypothetical protein EBR82_12065 [Caulobacteraceae bacterium]|nr:hypothetical protein [Caulobacteraceae bacterium]
MKPLHNNILSKEDLFKEITRLINDKDRGISVKNFAEVCGLDKTTLMKVFIYKTRPFSEFVQIRVNRGYSEWKKGNIRVMQRRDASTFPEYRKTPRVPLMPRIAVTFKDGKPVLKIGMANRHDYSEATIDEILKG